ncbi:hypothetical protein B0T11DRAFT_231260 [Plectosphaerella cucumerina]|uniref:Glycosyl transferase CAP10 domain-containing protein n=1 Tax=Plectosphaerella cucumerina TaxID=40658 RepID=A0A8K0TF17_9PEZI|nr:hypothetical protein B0T11DRAFT_231260 [Plectosphaerella cucumerina]
MRLPRRPALRRRRLVLALGLVFFLACAYTLFKLPGDGKPEHNKGARRVVAPKHEGEDSGEVRRRPLPADKRPQPAGAAGTHPISNLIRDAAKEFEAQKSRQSKTLKEAVAEYKRRYGMPPPPHFDKWYEFARSNDVQLIDEFDQIYDMILPFWGLKPRTIRMRAKEALGYDNFLLMMLIRNHEVTHVQGAHLWQREATAGMVSKFIQYLPNMDLAFNIHDEPRVILPHDDLARLIQKAKEVNIPKLNEARLENEFTKRPRGLGGGGGMDEVKTTRFNVYAQQPTWTTSRMSCPVDSPARSLEDDEQFDDTSKYGVSDLGFVYNVTAMSDICLTPSLSETYGFFDRPNAFNVVHDLVPVFSQSKISSYQDLVYPSPWYWHGKVEYDEKKDVPWDEKTDKLYWRGSTTGGYSRDGGWRRQHRQHFVRKINGKGHALIYVNDAEPGAPPHWRQKDVARTAHRDAIDVHFAYIGQCDKGDCDAQIEYFDLRDRQDQQDAWRFRYLLDIDGNAFSGRFYAFLKSRSLTFKLAIFREWHFEWLKPWVHYVPLSLQGDDWLEAVRFFGAGGSDEEGEPAGAEEGRRMAAESTEWAGKVLRKEDMEVWFFRLLLE